MKREHLEQFLNKGYQLGFSNPVEDPTRLGWILICKREHDQRYLSLLESGEEPEFVASQELIRKCPYQVQVIEIRLEAVESDQTRSDDYFFNEVLHMATLDAVEEFVEKFGHRLEDIKWRKEINAP